MIIRNKIISNTVINIISTVISFAIAYAMTPVILNRIGTDAYGIWVFLGIFSITGYFSLLDFGLQGAAIKYIAEFSENKNYDKLQSVISATLVFFLLAGFIAALLLLGFNLLFLTKIFNLPVAQIHLISILVNITAISFLFQFPAMAFSSFIEGIQRYDYLRGLTIATTLLSNLIIYLFLRYDNGLTFMVIISLITSLAITVGYALFAKKMLPQIKLSVLKFKKDTFKILFGLSSRLFASKIIGLIFNNTDKILIGIFLTVAYQTNYDIVNKLHVILLSILGMFNSAILPATSAISAKNDKALLRQLLLKSTKYSSFAILPAFLLIMIFSREILSIWVGKEYTSLAPLVRLYSAHIIITMLVGISSTMLVGVNKVGYALKISIWAAILNIVISVGTVHKLGLAGLILGTTLSYIISSLIYIFVTNRLFEIRNFDFLKKIIIPLLPAAITSFIALLLFNHFYIISTFPQLVLLGLCSYTLFGIVFYFTGLDINERIMGKEFLHKLISKITKISPNETSVLK